MPKISDNGSKVILDLHGCTVDEAIDLFYDVIELASKRGRHSLEVVHGHSTTSQSALNRTIKSEFYHVLSAGEVEDLVAATSRTSGTTLLSLNLSGKSNPKRISLNEVW